MGQTDPKKLVLLTVCFFSIALIFHGINVPELQTQRVPLAQALKGIRGWNACGLVSLDPKVIKALDLDDYTYDSYTDGVKRVFLYVGYYQSTMKIGAVHDPLVCFPGQGWVVAEKKRGNLDVHAETVYPIAYSSLIVERGEQRELVIYWFQSFDRTSPDIFTQKLRSLWQRIRHRRGENAFVRVSVPLQDRSLSECQEAAIDFIRAFYPVFIDYMKGTV